MRDARAVLSAFGETRWRLLTLRTKAEVRRWQDVRAARLFAEIAPRSPHTRQRLSALGLDLARHPSAWRAMPPIDKAEMMRSFDDLVTVPVRREAAMAQALQAEATRDFTATISGVTVGLSSGTSGTRGLFVASAAERAGWVGTLLARALPDVAVRAHRVAFFLRANSTLYEALGSRRLSFRYFDLSRALDEHVPPLLAFAPSVLVAPASVLVALSERIEPSALRPRRVISVAEVLDPVDERRLRAFFRQPIHQIYQATEGLLGTTCAFGTMHLAEDITAFDFEPADPADPCGPHVVPVVTNLFRSAQPIVRYRLDDVLQLRATPCSCRSPFQAVHRIDGRCDDVLQGRTPDGSQLRPVFGDLVTRAVLRASDPSDYDVYQPDPEHLDLAISAPRVDDAALTAALQSTWTGLGLRPPKVAIGTAIEKPAGTVKRRHIVRGPRPGVGAPSAAVSGPRPPRSAAPSPVALYGPAEAIPWPVSDDGDTARRWLGPLLRDGLVPYVRNVSAALRVAIADGLAIPYTLTEPKPQSSYVTSVYTHYIDYGADEIPKLDSPAVEAPLRALVSAIGAAFRRARFDEVVLVNNWLLSTNLYPRLSHGTATRLLLALVRENPDRAIVFRSVDLRRGTALARELADAGCKLVFSRRVLYQDPSDPAVWEKKQVWRDLAFLRRGEYQVRTLEEVGGDPIPRLRELYDRLYLEKYSPLNPQLTDRYLRHLIDQKLLHVRVIAKGDQVDAVIGSYVRDGVLTTPLCGYDTHLPQELGLYRLLSMAVTLDARDLGVLVNDSAGVGHFKRLRGSQPFLEYNAVYDRHLPAHRRAPWTLLRVLLDRVGVPIIEAKDL